MIHTTLQVWFVVILLFGYLIDAKPLTPNDDTDTDDVPAIEVYEAIKSAEDPNPGLQDEIFQDEQQKLLENSGAIKEPIKQGGVDYMGQYGGFIGRRR